MCPHFSAELGKTKQVLTKIVVDILQRGLLTAAKLRVTKYSKTWL
jgi:hypothetical protein